MPGHHASANQAAAPAMDSAADLADAGVPSTIVIADHVNRFCPGTPLQPRSVAR